MKRVSRRYDTGEKRMMRYEEAMKFLLENHPKPSRYIPEKRDMRNWWKATKKKMNVLWNSAIRVD